MSKEFEINYCNARISSTNSQIASSNTKISGYKRKIKALKESYRSIQTIKSDFRTKKNALVTLQRNADNSWVGNLFNTAYDTPVEDLVAEVEKVIRKIDDNLDNINDKINAYENIMMQEESFLGGLYSILNSLWGELENLMN